MKKNISGIVSEIYRHYLKQAEKDHTTFDIDLPDPTMQIEDAELITTKLSYAVRLALGRAKGGRIAIETHAGEIIVRDNGPALRKTESDKLNQTGVIVKSRVGYGTRAIIKIND